MLLRPAIENDGTSVEAHVPVRWGDVHRSLRKLIAVPGLPHVQPRRSRQHASCPTLMPSGAAAVVPPSARRLIRIPAGVWRGSISSAVGGDLALDPSP